jgi:hypothetical protein
MFSIFHLAKQIATVVPKTPNCPQTVDTSSHYFFIVSKLG